MMDMLPNRASTPEFNDKLEQCHKLLDELAATAEGEEDDVDEEAKGGEDRETARKELAALLPQVADAIEDELVCASGNTPPPQKAMQRD